MTKEELLNLPYEVKLRLIVNKMYLDIFIEEEDSWIRLLVAEQGYGLDKLIKDENSTVRQLAKNKLDYLHKVYELAKVIKKGE